MNLLRFAAGASRRPAPARSGMSLVELLVVVAIIITLSTITLRTFTPPLKDRQVREGSRVLSAALQSVRAKALQTGRRHGLVLERLTVKSDAGVKVLPTACRRMYTVSAQPPYQGDYTDSVATYRWRLTTHFPTTPTNKNFWRVELIRLGSAVRLDTSPSANPNVGLNDLDYGFGDVRNGSVIRIGAVDFKLDFRAEDSGWDPLTSRVLNAPTPTVPWPLANISTNINPPRARATLWTGDNTPTKYEAPYALSRSPVRLVGSEVELPEGAAISMESSGWHDNSEAYDVNGNITGGRSIFNAGLRGLGSSGDPAYHGPNQPIGYVDTPNYEAYTDMPAVVWFGPDGGLVEVWYGGWAIANGSDNLYSGKKYALTSTPSTVLAMPIEPSGRPLVAGSVFPNPMLASTALSQPLLLLVCPIEQCDLLPFAKGPGTRQPWMGLSNRWITLNPVTGRVQTFEVYLTSTSLGHPANMTESRWLARRGNGVSGN